MTPDIITTFVIATFLLILLSGFLFGLGRGFNKSLVRILLVVAMLVITFFVVPSITKAVMSADISSWGITIAGETVTSVPDIIVSALNEIPQVADIAGTEAYATIINVVPQMVLNVVLFVVVFILLRLVSMIIYWIISGICFSKKKTEGKNKHRLLGSLVGVVQNFIIFLVILVPVVGTVNILGDIETITTQPTTEAVSPASASMLSADETPEETPEENTDNNQVSPYQTVNDVIDAYKASWVAKFLHGVKLDNACMYVFNELSTVTEDEQEYNLREEANSIAIIAVDVMALVDLGEFDLSNPDTVVALNKVIDSCYNGKLTAGLADELIKLAAQRWTTPDENGNYGTIFGISRPTIDGYDDVLTDLLVKLGSSEDLQTTLKSTTKMAQSLFSAADKIVTEDGINIESIGDLLTDLSQDETTFEITKDVIQSNLDTILDTIFPTPPSEEPENPDAPEDPENPTEKTPEETYKAMISETINSIFSADYTQEENNIANEIAVVTETLSAAEKLMNPDAEDPFVQDDANAVIEKLSESTVILNTLSAENSDIRTKLNEELAKEGNAEAQEMVKSAIESLSNENANKELLMQIFGFAATEPTPPADPVE